MKLTPNMIYWGLMTLAAVALTCAVVRNYCLTNKSGYTKKHIASVLRRMAPLREWKVLNQVSLPSKDGTVTADHVVVAPFGILVLSDLHQRGNYYGEMRDDNWIISTGGEDKPSTMRLAVPSPAKNNEAFVAALRVVLAANKLYNIQVETLVPVTQTKIDIFVTGAAQVVAPYGHLRDALNKAKYQKDNGVDVGKILAVLTPSK